MFNIVIFGPPGSGKGTQAEKLAEKYNLTHLSTGDLLRQEMQKGSELGKTVKALIDKGELAPDDIVVELIKKHLNNNLDSVGFIFDGFPRTVPQAKVLDEMLKGEGLDISTMFTLEVTEEELIARILKRGENSGRADDSDTSIIKNRIKIYNEQTSPVAEYYKQQGKHISIDNMGTIDKTFDSITLNINL